MLLLFVYIYACLSSVPHYYNINNKNDRNGDN